MAYNKSAVPQKSLSTGLTFVRDRDMEPALEDMLTELFPIIYFSQELWFECYRKEKFYPMPPEEVEFSLGLYFERSLRLFVERTLGKRVDEVCPSWEAFRNYAPLFLELGLLLGGRTVASPNDSSLTFSALVKRFEDLGLFKELLETSVNLPDLNYFCGKFTSA